MSVSSFFPTMNIPCRVVIYLLQSSPAASACHGTHDEGHITNDSNHSLGAKTDLCYIKLTIIQKNHFSCSPPLVCKPQLPHPTSFSHRPRASFRRRKSAIFSSTKLSEASRLGITLWSSLRARRRQLLSSAEFCLEGKYWRKCGEVLEVYFGGEVKERKR
jgi:hypothetical protein